MACDGAYAPQLATCLRSMVESNRPGWPLDVFIIVESFPETLRTKVLESLPSGSVSVRWIDEDLSHFTEFRTADYISRMTFARLLIPEIMPQETSRLVYLDADILVLRDLSPLWGLDLDGHPIGAIPDNLDMHIKSNTPGFENVPRVRFYFNAGVLVIDLHRWREEQVSERARDYLLSNPSSPYADQDALNVVCDGRWKALPAHWNYQDHIGRRIEDLGTEKMPAIVHFVTTLKPWKPTSLSLNASFYDSYRKRTRFARTLGQRVADGARVLVYRTRRYLGRYRLLRAMRDRFALILRSRLAARHS